MNDSKTSALQKLKQAREGGIKRTDQYEVIIFDGCNFHFRSKNRREFLRKLAATSTKPGRLLEETTTSSLMMMVSAIRTMVAKFGRRMKMMTELEGTRKRSENSAKVTRQSTRLCSIQVWQGKSRQSKRLLLSQKWTSRRARTSWINCTTISTKTKMLLSSNGWCRSSLSSHWHSASKRNFQTSTQLLLQN